MVETLKNMTHNLQVTSSTIPVKFVLRNSEDFNLAVIALLVIHDKERPKWQEIYNSMSHSV